MLRFLLLIISISLPFPGFSSAENIIVRSADNDVWQPGRKIVAKGVLQAYWLPVWNDDFSVNNPVLNFRFFAIDKNESEVVNISGISVEQLNQYFLNIPIDFFKYKEGHVEQYGEITLKKLQHYTECGRDWIYAESVVFFAKDNGSINLNDFESSAGCEKYPYVITYVAKPGINILYLKSSPDDDAVNIETVTVGTTMTNIRDVGNGWVYVAIYDENAPDLAGEKRGYINREYVTPVN